MFHELPESRSFSSESRSFRSVHMRPINDFMEFHASMRFLRDAALGLSRAIFQVFLLFIILIARNVMLLYTAQKIRVLLYCIEIETCILYINVRL